MKVITKINNNAAIALDGSNTEIVILGSGVGFPKTPYELDDLSKIEKTFYDVDPKYIEMMGRIPQEIILASADVIEQTETNLESELNPNLLIVLADHLSFAIDRIVKGINITAPLAYDVSQLYSEEYELGLLALDIVEDYTGIRLPTEEAVNIALHLVNGEIEKEDMHSVLSDLRVIENVDRIIEESLCIRLDREGFAYNRFLMHLRYLMKRLSQGKPLESDNFNIYDTFVIQFPEVYACAKKAATYLESNYKSKCNKDEVLYLMLHINRMKEKAQ